MTMNPLIQNTTGKPDFKVGDWDVWRSSDYFHRSTAAFTHYTAVNKITKETKTFTSDSTNPGSTYGGNTYRNFLRELRGETPVLEFRCGMCRKVKPEAGKHYAHHAEIPKETRQICADCWSRKPGWLVEHRTFSELYPKTTVTP